MIWIRNIATNYLRFITSLLVMAVMTPIIIDHIGKDGYGLWVLVYAAVSIVGLSDLGFATAAIKFLSGAEAKEKDELVGCLTRVYALLSLLCLMIVIGCYLNGFTAAPQLFLMLGLTTVLTMACSVHRALLVSAGHQAVFDGIVIFTLVVQTIITLVLLDAGFGVNAVAISYAVSFSLQALLCIPAANRLVGFNPSFDNVNLNFKKITRFSIWALLANTAFLIILRIDPLIIESLISLEAVALFAIALKIAEQALLFNKQFSNALMPLVSRLQNTNAREHGNSLFLLSTKYCLAFATPFLALLAINAEALIVTWVGVDFRPAATLLQVLLVAIFFSTLQFNAANLNGMSGNHHIVATSLLMAATIKVLLTIELLPRFDLIGAAIATLVAVVSCEATINLRQACRYSHTPFRNLFTQAVMPGLICSTPSILLALLVPTPQGFVSLILVNALYGILAIALFIIFFVGTEDQIQVRKLLKLKEEKSCAPSIAA